MRVWIFGVWLVVASQLTGQGKAVFEKDIHDFGSLKEEGLMAEYAFRFTNEGDTSVQITNVAASCGCTTPKWTSEPINPGDTGQVIVRYSTINRPGPFNKSILVSTSGSQESHMLFVKGRVIPTPKSPESELRVQYGAMKLKHRSLNMGKITTEKAVVKSFQFLNSSDSTLHIDSTSIDTPAHIKLDFEPIVIEPNGLGEILMNYDPNEKNGLGYHMDKVSFLTNESPDSLKSLYVIATVEEYFPPMSEEELDQAPKLFLDKSSLNLSKANQGDTLSAQVVLKNVGREELLIRSIQSNCVCVATTVESQVIQPSEEATLTILFDTSGRRGRQYKSLTIFSNDPKAPAQTITIRADVEVDN